MTTSIASAGGASALLCAGCPTGFAGRPGACVPCNASAGDVCPGLLSAPLPSLSQLRAALADALASLSASSDASGTTAGENDWGVQARRLNRDLLHGADSGDSNYSDHHDDDDDASQADGEVCVRDSDFVQTDAELTDESKPNAATAAISAAHAAAAIFSRALKPQPAAPSASPSPAPAPGCATIVAVARRYSRALAAGSVPTVSVEGDASSWTGGYTGIVTVAGLALVGIAVWSFLALRQSPPVQPDAAPLEPPPCCCPGGCTARSSLLTADLFGARHLVPPFAAPRRVRTPLGGCCTLLSLLLVATYWAVLIAQRQSAPELFSRSVGGLSQEQLQLPVQAVGGQSATGLVGLHVIVTAAGEAGACRAANWTDSGLLAGHFTLVSSASCGTLAQHVFACPGCVVQGSSLLRLSMDWSCQALLFQSYAVSPDGIVTFWDDAAATGTATATSAAANSTSATVQLLSYVSWEPQPMLLLRTDNTKTPAIRTRGYALLGGPLLARTSQVVADSFLPSAQRLDVDIILSPASIYADTVVTERVPISQLAASLLGVLSLIGVVATLFSLSEPLVMRWLPHAGVKMEGRAPKPSQLR